MAYELRESGGLASSRLGLEILFLLPDDFVQIYGALFHRALAVGDDSVMHGRSGGVDKAKGRTGMQLGTADRGGQASATGKKFKNQRIPIASDRMLTIKEGVDKELMMLTRKIKNAMAARPGEVTEGMGKTKGKTAQCTNISCRSFLNAEWRFCPRCGDGV